MFLRYRSSAWVEGIAQGRDGMRVRGNISMIDQTDQKIIQSTGTSS